METFKPKDENTGMNPKETKKKAFKPDETEKSGTVTSAESKKDVSDEQEDQKLGATAAENTGRNPKEAKKKAFITDKTEKSDTETVQEQEDRKSGATAAEADSTRPKYKAATATQTEMIAVGPEGCEFISEYAKLDIPDGAVEHIMHIEITPHYTCEFNLDGKILMTPIIEFRSKNEIKFLKDIKVFLYTPYSAAEHGKPVKVEVMRKKHSNNELQLIDTVELDQDCWIPFKTTEMCRVYGVEPESDAPYITKHFYTSAIVRDGAEHQKIISWMVCEDMPNMREINKEYFEVHHSRMVMEPYKFKVRYEYGLRLKLQSQGRVLMPSEVENPGFAVAIPNGVVNIPLRQSYCIGFDEKSQMLIAQVEPNAPPEFTLILKFQIDAVAFNINLPDINKINKICHLIWKNESQTAEAREASAIRQRVN